MWKMKFTYEAYCKMCGLLINSGYEITDYCRHGGGYNRCVILRHDIDTDLQKALAFARIEKEHKISSTYFVLLTSNFYNLFTRENKKIVNEIKNLGHTIGLHFDETAYPSDVGNVEKITLNIKKEIRWLSDLLEDDVRCFSYHRPSKAILDADIKIDGLINSYGNTFFKDFKYLSDSRMNWREPLLDIIKSEQYNRLHILTHPFWYHEAEIPMETILVNFLKRANMDRYDNLNDNFTNLGEIISRERVERK